MFIDDKSEGCMSNQMKLENFEERLAHAAEFCEKNNLRVMHFRGFRGGGVTVIYRHLKKNSFVEISTAVCSNRDQYNKKIGRILATENFERGNVIRVPSRGYFARDVLSRMFDYVI
jgi:hypothetical protein